MESYFESLMFSIIRYDMLNHGDSFEIAVYSQKKKIVNTIQKELISKYDPEFISQIKMKDGIAD